MSVSDSSPWFICSNGGFSAVLLQSNFPISYKWLTYLQVSITCTFVSTFALLLITLAGIKLVTYTAGSISNLVLINMLNIFILSLYICWIFSSKYIPET